MLGARSFWILQVKVAIDNTRREGKDRTRACRGRPFFEIAFLPENLLAIVACRLCDFTLNGKDIARSRS